MKILKILLLLVVVLALAFVVAGLVFSPAYEVTRSIVIKAPPERIHEYVADLKRWDEFMPWKEQAGH